MHASYILFQRYVRNDLLHLLPLVTFRLRRRAAIHHIRGILLVPGRRSGNVVIIYVEMNPSCWVSPYCC